MDRKKRAIAIIEKLRDETKDMIPPAATEVVRLYGRNPYLVLVSCILSLRTKDSVSLLASIRLFEKAQTPQQLLELPPRTVEKLIYPVGFYRRKTEQLYAISKQLLVHYNGNVPSTESDLLSLPGVGRKTMNLVLSEGFDVPALCVDTHVHRISNRLGLVSTKTPGETEVQLKKILPKQYWSEYNRLLVMWGQNICVPTSPFCSKCPLLTANLCPQIGVTTKR